MQVSSNGIRTGEPTYERKFEVRDGLAAAFIGLWALIYYKGLGNTTLAAITGVGGALGIALKKGLVKEDDSFGKKAAMSIVPLLTFGSVPHWIAAPQRRVEESQDLKNSIVNDALDDWDDDDDADYDADERASTVTEPAAA